MKDDLAFIIICALIAVFCLGLMAGGCITEREVCQTKTIECKTKVKLDLEST